MPNLNKTIKIAIKNNKYANKWRQKKQADGNELQEEKQLVKQGLMNNFVNSGTVQTDRGDSILPKQGQANGLFPDLFSSEERAKIQSREADNLYKQQLNMQRSEEIRREEKEEKKDKQEKGKLGDESETILDRTLGTSGTKSEKTVRTWEI